MFQSIASLNSLLDEEIEEVGVADVLGTLAYTLRLRVAVELIQLRFEQVDLVLPRHDILPLLGLFFSLSRHRREVIIDHVEYA